MTQRRSLLKSLFLVANIVLAPTLLAESNASSWAFNAGYAGSEFGMDNAGQSKGGRLAIENHFLPNYWHNIELFLQVSAAYYDSSYAPLEPPHRDNLWVFAATPVARYHITPEASIDPFIDLGSGPGYLSAIYYENRNLGLHFTFQNMLGVGANFGSEHAWSTELQIFHYSNAGISSHNRGFTSPIFLSVGYEL